MAKVVIFLTCLVLFVVAVFGRGGRRGGTPCKTDNTCGDNPVTEALDGTDYCCAEGSRIRLRPPRGAMTEAKCKCIEPRGGGGGGGGGRRRGRGPRGRGHHGQGPNGRGFTRCNYQNDCGEGAVSDTANGRPVCCPAGQVITKKTIQRGERSREKCHCQMPEAELA